MLREPYSEPLLVITMYSRKTLDDSNGLMALNFKVTSALTLLSVVTIRLDPENDPKEETRIIKLKEGGQVKVGRASGNALKQMLAAADNAWIKSPILSRSHAMITASNTTKVMCSWIPQ